MATATINLELQRTMRLIPGYDPFASPADCWFDEEAAVNAIAFFPERLKHIEGALAGEPFALEPWEQAIVGNLFGWKRRDAKGREIRRYRECLIFVPRKNGKTPLAAGIGLYCLFCEAERGQQNYIAASTREQAGLLFRHARGMVDQCDELSSLCRVYGGNAPGGQSQSIVRESRGSFLKIISSDVTVGKHGKNLNLAIVDELHEQVGRDLVDTLRTSMASANKPQPLMIYTTTSDFDREGSICNEIHDYASQVRDGIVDDPKFLPVIYEATPEDDWTSPDVWARVNPNLGISVSLEYLQDECKKAQENPSRENTFKRLHLNVRTGQDKRWIPMDKWDACSDARDPIAWRSDMVAALKGKMAWPAFDIGSTSDLTALALVFPKSAIEPESAAFIVLPYFWVPRESAIRRSKQDRVDYMKWIQQGFVTPTEGTYSEVTDFGFVRRDINQLGAWFSFAKAADTGLPIVVFDRLFQGDQMATDLASDGFEPVPFGQGFMSMAAPAKRFEELIISGLLDHGNNPVLRWMASNAAKDEDAAGNIKPSKKKSSEKIDGIVATIMALSRVPTDQPIGESIYNDPNQELAFL
ncbi:MAG: terminase TerL endonuclease subunit [Sulfurimonas sp.]|jgi:phage terminase large subunit-like protein